MRLSAYSTTTIAPSTNMPTARIRPNITIFEIEIPITARKTKHSRKEVGMAKPTRKAGRDPRAAKTTIITRAMAVRTDPSNCLTILSTLRDWSLEVLTSMACCNSTGQSAVCFSTSARTKLAVSIRLNPLRFTTWIATVVSPLNRAVPVRSAKVRRMSAISPSVTTRPPLIFIGRLYKSNGSSNEEGIFTAKFELAVSTVPAGIN